MSHENSIPEHDLKIIQVQFELKAAFEAKYRIDMKSTNHTRKQISIPEEKGENK